MVTLAATPRGCAALLWGCAWGLASLGLLLVGGADGGLVTIFSLVENGDAVSFLGGWKCAVEVRGDVSRLGASLCWMPGVDKAGTLCCIPALGMG